MAVPEERLITARDLFDLKFVGDPQVSPNVIAFPRLFPWMGNRLQPVR